MKISEENIRLREIKNCFFLYLIVSSIVSYIGLVLTEFILIFDTAIKFSLWINLMMEK